MRPLAKLRRRLKDLRAQRRSMRSVRLKRFAEALGYVRVSRGKEPTWEKPGRRPITNPDHAGDMAVWTVDNILDRFEEELFYMEAEAGNG